MDLARHGVEHEVRVAGLAINKVRDLLPLLPSVDAADLEDGTRGTRDYRPPLERKALPGDPFRRPEEFVLYQLGVYRVGGPARCEGNHTLDQGGRAVGWLIRLRPGDPRPQPARPLGLDHRDGVALGHMENDVPVPVQTAGSIAVDLARRPAVSIPGLPYQSRIRGVHSHAFDVALESKRHRVCGDCLGKPDQERIVGFGHPVEAIEVSPVGQRVSMIAHLLLTGQAGANLLDGTGNDG